VNLYQIVIDIPLKEEVRFKWRYAETTREALESAMRTDNDENNIVIGIVDEDGVYIRTEHLIEKQDND
jgi:isochorismate hydrolase